MRLSTLTAFALLTLPLACLAQTTPGGPMPPRSWVDKDTGHRVWRLSDEPNSGGFYFNINAYTPDGKQMIYTAPDGIHVLEMATRTTKLLVANPPRVEGGAGAPGAATIHALVVGHKTNSVFYTSTNAAGVTSVYKADTNSGAIRKLVDVPKLPNTSSLSVVSVNADETLVAGHLHRRRTHRQGVWREPAVPRPARSLPAQPDNRVASAAQGPHYQPRQQGPDDGNPARGAASRWCCSPSAWNPARTARSRAK